ncbi:MAG: 3'-5' exonuclease [Alphaproteobacteria bacterium]|nr:3'-5' exonuclease [Alphaproteobacteria bacterium]
MARSTYFCVDIECSGPVPHLYDMISLGVVPVLHTPGSVPPAYAVVEAKFYVEIRPEGPLVDPGAMAVNRLDLDLLKREGTPLPQALDQLDAFVAAHLLPGTKPVFVGHNAPFDWMFVTYAYTALKRRNPFGYKALDTKALASGVLRVHWEDSSKEVLADRLDLPDVVQDQVHRADYDAWYQAHILARLLEAAGIDDEAPPVQRS